MNPDDDLRDGQDDETPEEMVNRSLAEALENQQRYMEMFQNSAHVLQVLSRFMSDPIVVQDLEIMSDDGTTSSASHMSPSASITTSPMTCDRSKNDESVVSHRIFGGCTDTVTMRDGRLRSARPQRFGRQRQIENETRVQRLHSGVDQEGTERTGYRNGNGETRSSILCQEGAGDTVLSKVGNNDPLPQQSSAGSLVSTGCQTQGKTVSQSSIGVGDTKGIRSEVTSGRHRESIGVATQTSINSAMTEISKATDTIRRARTMLSSLNLGASSLRARAAHQMNNNNHKETEGCDRDDDASKELAQTGQGDAKKEEIKVSAKQFEASSHGSSDETTSNKINSIFVAVKPSDKAISNGDDEGSTVQQVPSCSGLIRCNEQGKLHGCDLGQSRTQVEELNPHGVNRQRATVTLRIGGASFSPEIPDNHSKTALNETQVSNTNTTLCALETNKIPFQNTLCPAEISADKTQGRMPLTLEMFRDALNKAIGNLQKEGLWVDDAANNVNVKHDSNDDNRFPMSKIDTNCFALNSPNVSLSRKQFLLTPCCSSRCSSDIRLDSNGMQFSGGECYQLSSNSREEDTDSGRKQSDVESTYGHCSSIHLSPVLAFNEDDITDDETTTSGYADVSHTSGIKTEACVSLTPRRTDNCVDLDKKLSELCPEDLLSDNPDNPHGYLNKLGSGDAVSPHMNAEGGDGKIHEGGKGVAVAQHEEKQGFFRRLTSAIKSCSLKKKKDHFET